ncbi:MAG: HD-GYP domain-containing protein [Dethiobacteria bacterium]|jgi:HD-GYP domain-containing protein (c-di-GMP phosphodiesterase class II)
MRKVSVLSLQPGMKLARPIYDTKGFLLLNSGVELKKEYIRNLKKHSIFSVYIIDKIIPDVDIEDVILDETRQKTTVLIKDIMLDIEKQPKKSIPKLLFTKRNINGALQEIIDQLINNKNLIINLTDIRIADNYTFAHSVNVAVMAITAGISLGLSRSQLKKVGLGSILHDLGKVKIPSCILNKEGKLSPDEFLEIKKHPGFGYEMVKTQELIPASSAIIIYQHHERMNGEGYPEGLKSEQINLFSRISAVADVYDALVADRPYHSAYPPYKAIEILESSGELFDLKVLRNFIQHIAAYPIGTFLGLSSGEIGIVVNNTVGHPTRPRVRILCSKDGFEPLIPYELDLMEKRNVVIDMVFNDDEIPEEILNRPTT